MLISEAESIAQDLRSFDETETAQWVLDCSEEELVRVCSVADWLLYNGPKSPSGNSMKILKALALAAVYVHEGEPRELRRKRRRILEEPKIQGGRLPNWELQRSLPKDYGVGDNAREFWQTD